MFWMLLKQERRILVECLSTRLTFVQMAINLYLMFMQHMRVIIQCFILLIPSTKGNKGLIMKKKMAFMMSMLLLLGMFSACSDDEEVLGWVSFNIIHEYGENLWNLKQKNL